MLLYMTTMTICETTKTQFYQKLKEASNFPEPDTCPIPKVRWILENQKFCFNKTIWIFAISGQLYDK